MSTYTSVLRLARFFKDLGVKAEDVIAIDYTNKPALLHMWLALASLGAVPALINYNLSGDRLEHCIKVSGSRLLIVDEAVSEKVMRSELTIKGLEITVVYLDNNQLDTIKNLEPFRSDFDPRMNKQTSLSTIFFTR